MSNIVEKLTENIVERNLQRDGVALLDKWESTGLLEGLHNERAKTDMARMLENQAKELLREASTMSAGDVEGFAAVAFPIVRRVFGGLISNELVSVQPMSLPSGLIFFLDFQTTTGQRGGFEENDSLYGGNVVGQQITGGVDLTGEGAEESFYSLNQGYSSPTGTVDGVRNSLIVIGEGIVGNNWDGGGQVTYSGSYSLEQLVLFDPDLEGKNVAIATIDVADLGSTGSALYGISADSGSAGAYLNKRNYVAIDLRTTKRAKVETQVRRLTREDPVSGSSKIMVVFAASGTATPAGVSHSIANGGEAAEGSPAISLAFIPAEDNFRGTPTAQDSDGGNALGAVAGTALWDLENQTAIPEIDIKVDSISVTAMTKKLKAKWSPELGQDLNAYHNLDAEVELTSILSEQIALEIDREVLNDLVQGATGGKLYWSRRPGRFLNRETGADISSYSNESLLGADFTGTVSEWYETLLETINDVSARIHRKTIRGGANFMVCGPEIASVLEMTAGFRASVVVDGDTGTAGAVKVGSVSKKWDVYVDPYFLRNVILVGRKGGSFLESGYVYAPYVPLQVTPTIFGPEDFVPRKGVMTRYAKKMVRSDMYGVVYVKDLLG